MLLQKGEDLERVNQVHTTEYYRLSVTAQVQCTIDVVWTCDL